VPDPHRPPAQSPAGLPSAAAPDAAGTGSDDARHARTTAWVSGRVQGVGFRWATRARALELGLVGWAANRPDGRVEVVAEGPQAARDALVTWLRSGSGRPGRVSGVVATTTPARGGLRGFEER
jgi:acylphosphatase